MRTFLNLDLQLREAFVYIIFKEDSKDYIKKILTLIRDNKLDTDNQNKILTEYNIKRVEDIKEDLLDMLFAYITFVLDDSFITDNEAMNFKQLKRFFRIREGDFYKYHYRKIEDVLDKQFEHIYADNKIDTKEALHKVGLQELFDLSYDQFLKLVNKEVRAAFERGPALMNLTLFLLKHTKIKGMLNKKNNSLM